MTTDLAPLVGAGVPAETLAVYTALTVWEQQGKGGPTARMVALHFGKSYKTAHRWLRDLVDLGLSRSEVVDRTHSGRPVLRYWTAKADQREIKARKAASGRALRCAVCRRLNPRGQWCAKCKQTHGRSDRAWWPLCDRLLRKGKTPNQVAVLLAKEAEERGVAWHFSVWDFVPPGQDLKAPGIVSRGLIIGALGPEWAEHQANHFGGESEEW